MHINMKKIKWFQSSLMILGVIAFTFSAAVADTIEADSVKVLDFAQLEKAKDLQTKDGLDVTGIPKEILEMQGKKVKVTGYFSIPIAGFYDNLPVNKFAVLRYAYGCPCCNWGSNPPPTVFNTIFVDMKQGETLKPNFTPQVNVTGTFVATREYYNDENGVKTIYRLFYIKDAEVDKIDPGWLYNLGF